MSANWLLVRVGVIHGGAKLYIPLDLFESIKLVFQGAAIGYTTSNS